ncbi:hypothetical protein [Haloferula sp. BvORR071]|uniref:hypothetical protein n=1 Tax=Haloferula sp. BvORR071 TaxID=1396141 RepID=UPI0005524562|nr:hypothetical protein [Haloferula sp. BvORR071]
MFHATQSGSHEGSFHISINDDTHSENQQLRFTQSLGLIYYPVQEKGILCYSTGYWIWGLMLESLTLRTRSYCGALSKHGCERLLQEVCELPLKELDVGKEDGDQPKGCLRINGKSHPITAGPQREARRKWQDFFDNGLKTYAPADQWRENIRTIEGEGVKPLELDFATLLKNPAIYDGKRIAMSGYYQHGFENSSFSASKDEFWHDGNCVWLGGMSRYAEQKIERYDFGDTPIRVEGTYDFCNGCGGHMGGWRGELVRITSIQPIEAGEEEEIPAPMRYHSS